MYYYVIHLTETDGDCMAHCCQSPNEVKKYVKKHRFDKDDYILIKGMRTKLNECEN